MDKKRCAINNLMPINFDNLDEMNKGVKDKIKILPHRNSRLRWTHW